MPEILVIATAAEKQEKGVDEAVLMRERVRPSDFESDHARGQLMERVGWAVVDAEDVEHHRLEQRTAA